MDIRCEISNYKLENKMDTFFNHVQKLYINVVIAEIENIGSSFPQFFQLELDGNFDFWVTNIIGYPQFTGDNLIVATRSPILITIEDVSDLGNMLSGLGFIGNN